MLKAGNMVLRPATPDDAELLFGWVNASDSLANKLATRAPIAWSTHVAWLQGRVADNDCLLEIIEVDGRPAGQVRLEPRARGHIVDLYIAPDSRRSGLGRAALVDAIGRCAKRPIVALVKSDNAPSLALFRSLGFRDAGVEGGMVTFEFED